MPHLFLALTLLTGPANFGDIPAPALPSGMDLLYGDRIVLDANGEPQIPVGLMDGLEQTEFETHGPVTIDFYEQGRHKRSVIDGTNVIRAKLLESVPAEMAPYVQLETLPESQEAQLDKRLALWRARGIENVEAMADGTVLGIGGKMVNSKVYRLIVPVSSESEGEALISHTYRSHQIRGILRRRLVQRPWGYLALFVNGQPLGRATSYVRLSPNPGESKLKVRRVEYGRGYRWHGHESREYRGDIYVVVSGTAKLAVVNVAGAESILAGVVPSELFSTAHTEALKAQAVAARNILVSQLGQRHHTDPFHLCSAQHCQVYGGITKEQPTTTAAVKATTGKVLFHGPTLVNATYSSTCGGYTEHNENVWGTPPDPALRARPDFPRRSTEFRPFSAGINDNNIDLWVDDSPATYCQLASKMRSEAFRWTRTFDQRELARLLADKAPGVGFLRSVAILERGPGGRVMGLRLTGTKGVKTILYELPIRRFFNNLRSGTFAIETTTNPQSTVAKLTFRGAGWGHGVGMCQMGAIGRAETGHPHQSILEHYYGNASLHQLYQTSSLD